MGRKNKNIIGGATSGAGAGLSTGNPYAAIGGAALGGFLASQEDDSAQQLAPAIPQDVVDRLYRQSQGGEQTVGELKAAQMYDKTLAQQIAAAKTNRGVNPALLSRNVSRIAAEQSQANAASMAEVAAQERARALQQYLQAQSLNSGVAEKNAGFEAAANKKSDAMLAGGLNGLAGNLALNSQRSDAAGEIGKSATAAKSESIYNDTIKNPTTAQPAPYGGGLGNTALPDYSMGSVPSYSDERLKTKVTNESMKVTSDERQKNLVKTEDLPVNNNMGTQNMQAAQPAAAPQPVQAPVPQAMPQAAPAQPAAAPATSSFGLTPEMLAQAQQSSKRGGNTADIKNDSMTLSRGAQGPNNQQILDMTADAQRRQSRDIFGNVTQSDAENYQANLGRWFAARDAQNAAYDKQAGEVSMANENKDLQRTARLNRFYTGIDTNSAAVASQYAPKTAVQNSDWNSAQGAQRAAGIGDQSNSNGWQNIQGHLNQFARNPYAQVLAPGSAVVASGIAQTSDERQKQSVKKEDVGASENFNPKSFLDKLEAVSWEYKDSAKGLPGVEDGRKLGVMAQDLEKAGPVGESMVNEDAEGNKVVDYGAGFSAILASQAQLNKRLSQIETQYTTKKKKA